ncbi:VOC family protein [Dactylosporangium cerinum]|uniref:VOC family protein n=1 Tax=Dactylosporangium cerinum TaxID=1434730 RepID=A0ABV9VVU9_9ACTN
MPTARAVDHLAWTVPDLDAAVDFLGEHLGGACCYRQGPVQDPVGDWMTRKLAVHPRAVAHIAMVRLGRLRNLELFGYTAPDQRTTPPAADDVGAFHLGVHVQDVAAAADRLAAAGGVRRLGPSFLDTPAGRIKLTTGPEHVSYGVADLDATLAFVVEVLGGTPVGAVTTMDTTADPDAQELGVRPGTVRRVTVRLGPATLVELVEHRTGGRRVPPRNSDVGGHHLALHVEDVDAAARYLDRQPGVTVLGTPETVPDGPIAGDRWVYFATPVGLQMEVLHMPDGALPYERDTTARRATVSDWLAAPDPTNRTPTRPMTQRRMIDALD